MSAFFEIHIIDSPVDAEVKDRIISLLVGREDEQPEQKWGYWDRAFEEDPVRVVYIPHPSDQEVVIGCAVLRLLEGHDSAQFTFEAVAVRGSPTDPKPREITGALLEAVEEHVRLCQGQIVSGEVPTGSGNLPHAGDDSSPAADFTGHVVPGYHCGERLVLRNALALHRTLIPEFRDGVRFARKEDLPMMAKISIEGFYGNEIFKYIRPHHDQYVMDTWRSQEEDYGRLLDSPSTLCLVAENEFSVAGLSCWEFQENHQCTEDIEAPDPDAQPDGERRDEDPRAMKRLKKATNDIGERFFPNMWVCTKFVVLPEYQGTGVGSSMLRWALDCADMDGANQGVISSNKGAQVYRKHGFSHASEMVIRDDEGGVELIQEVLVRKASSLSEA